ncbi:hypothetical protein BKA56DRAFT_566104 [Ilyonectria sp. MPI-CAGE-AT-0026]|nr:hypothetical protein BKA56DRAFT_566104 [Ilyonectria sp. MPI-CAGE-AT-0026]
MANTSPAAAFAASPDQHAAASSSRHDESFTSQILPPLADAAASPRPGSETEKHPKGKRKRTAAKDKMILEEAYSNNAKPDKQARLEIVQRVSLNEKEVQIWFQNRRQNDRRKSRPLSAQEIAALRYGGMHVISSDPITNITPCKPEKTFPASDPASSRPTNSINASPRPLHQTPSISRSHSDIIASTPLPAGHEGIPRSYPEITPKHDEFSPSHESQDGSHSLSSSMSSSVGYLANRWNLGSSFSTPATLGRGGDDSFRFEPFPPSSCSSEPSQPSSQSKVRLSLSLEGKAELVSNQVSPTRNLPPRPSSTTPSLPHVRQRSLQRSHSALPSITLPPISTLTNSLPPRLMRGRSRDVHAWESCADAENRDELTAQAEHESNGSAIAAISLLRSSSGVLQPSGAKRNAPISKPQRPHHAKKARLNRSGSSISQLETEEEETEKPEKEYGKVKVSMLVSPSGDSDKENWSPDEDGNQAESHRRRLLPPAPPKAQNPRRLGRVLQEQKSSNILGNRSNTAPSRHRNVVKEGLEIFEDVLKCPPVSREDDVERFMRGEVSPSKKPDMDCVAGLLSLSQGAWR